MPGQKFELTDISGVDSYNSEANLTMDKEKKSGCYLSSTLGGALAVLVLLLVVAVGVIVFFAAEGKNIECECGQIGSGSNTGGNNPGYGAVTQECQDWAESGNAEVCKYTLHII